MTLIRDNRIYHIPTRTEIEGIEVGQQALDCWGRWAEVVSINYRGIDLEGRLFCGYSTKSSETSSISMSVKEDVLTRHVGMSAAHTSHELDAIEADLLVVRS